MISFNKVTFTDGNDSVPLSAENMNNIETALKTVCDGGSGSGNDADTVRGQIITNAIHLTKGLIAHWDMSLPEYPDKAASAIYFRRDWPVVDSWAAYNSDCTINVASNHLTVTQVGTAAELIFNRDTATLANKTIKLKIKNTDDFTAIRVLDGAWSDMTLMPYKDYLIATYTASATLSTTLRFKIIMKGSANGTIQRISWIYAGDADYTSDLLDSTRSHAGTVYGATPVKNKAIRDSLYFDGVNDRVLLSVPQTALRTDAFSLVIRGASAWSNTTDNVLCALGTALKVYLPQSGNTLSVKWGSDSATPTFTLPNESTASTPSTIVITYSASAYKVYKDGVYLNGAAATGLDLSFTSIELGSISSASYFKGIIGPVAYYDRELNAQEVWELHQRPYILNEPFVGTRALPRTPATASSVGRPGEVVFDSEYVYICVAADTWKRAALSTW